MEIQEYIDQKKELQDILLDYIENDEEVDCLDLPKYIEAHNITDDIEEFKALLKLVMGIAKNHYHEHRFFDKIEKIILQFEVQIKQTFTNLEIFDMFKSNKKIILFLLSNKILTLDESLVNYLLSISEIKMKKYSHHYSLNNYNKYHFFFYPEIKTFVDGMKRRTIERELKKFDSNILNNFEEKRKIGENESYICQLIRDDSVEEFISYVNKVNLKLSSTIKPSVFETNSFLMNKEIELIKYAAFFGSIQIFQYLKLNNIELKPSLWMYAIHGKNADLIHILEESQVKPKDESYNECFREAIKCHHNDIANYIQNNLLVEKKQEMRIQIELFQSINCYCFHYYNYAYFPNDFNDKLIIFYLCKYNYLYLVKLLLTNKEVELDQKIILIVFNEIQQK